MSRLGKMPVSVPSGVSVSINGRKVTMQGKQGTLEYTHRPEVQVQWDEGEKSISVTVDPKDADNRSVRAYWGMTRALLANMIKGVSEGYERTLEVVGVGYTAEAAGTKLRLKVGYANTIEMAIPTGVNVNVEKSVIKVQGADKQAVGQFAAAVRAKRKPEPYNGKGIKYSDEVIRRKQGKAFGS